MRAAAKLMKNNAAQRTNPARPDASREKGASKAVKKAATSQVSAMR
jgi:hypothetical protein